MSWETIKKNMEENNGQYRVKESTGGKVDLNETENAKRFWNDVKNVFLNTAVDVTKEQVKSKFENKKSNESIWGKVQSIANNNFNRINNKQDDTVRDYSNLRLNSLPSVSNAVGLTLWDTIKDTANGMMTFANNKYDNRNRLPIKVDKSGQVDKENTMLAIAQRNTENAERTAKMMQSKEMYDEAVKTIENERLRNTVIYRNMKMQNLDVTEEELLEMAREKEKEISSKFIENLANMNPAEQYAKINAITKGNKKEELKIRSQIQSLEAKKEADKINRDLENGNYLSSIGHVVKGVPEGALDTVTKTTIGLASLLPEPNKAVGVPTMNDYLNAVKMPSKYQETTANIDNGIVKTGSGVSSTIGGMVPSILANLVMPGSGGIVNAINVGASEYIGALNEDNSNKGQAIATGTLKGTASYGIEKIAGGNFLSKGSLDDIAKQTIASKFSGETAKKVASKIYEFGGEVLEENLENQVGYVIDKVLNNKNITAEEWANDFGETTKNTILTTAVLNLLHLGGDTYREVVELEKDTKAKEIIKEAENIIKKENLEINSEKIKEKELRSVLNQVNIKENNQVQNNPTNFQQNVLENNLQSMYNSTDLDKVQNVPIESLLQFKTDGGYRNEQYMAKLRENIKRNGIKSPIELVRNNDGSIAIENGNHRLQVARELGLKEVPIKFVESWDNVIGNIDSNYNEYIESLGVSNDRNNGNSKEINIFNDRSRINEKYNTNNWIQLENRETTTGDDRLSNRVQGYNDRSSSTSTFKQNSKEVNNRGTNFQQDTLENPINPLSQHVTNQENKVAQNGNMEQVNSSNNYFNTVKKYNLDSNNETVKGIYDLASKRGINVLYDDTHFTNSKQNAKWSVDSEGNRSVILNPNADTNSALQSVMIHELTHDIVGTEAYNKINSMVLDKLQRSNNYDNLMLDIANAYENEYSNMSKEEFSRMIEQEAVADYLGENLGNQEFVNELVRSQDRSTIQKIIDWVKGKVNSFKNVVTGNQELNYWNKIKENFEKAYNQEYQGNNNENRLSIAGKEGMNNAIKQDTRYIQLERNYNKAQQMQEAGIDNERIRQSTNWFQDKNGDWKFEFSDKDMSIKPNIKLENNKTYKLGNILEHDTLFQIYPELVDYDVKVLSDTKSSGSFNKLNKVINISNKITKNNRLIEGTLIHEIQHAIQNVEGFEHGKTSNQSKLAYYNSLGEIEASNTKTRFLKEKYQGEDIRGIPPESSKVNPKHQRLDNYLENRNLFDKAKDSIYNYFNNKSGGKNNEIDQEIIFDNTEQNMPLVDGREGRRYVESKNNSDFFNLPTSEKFSKQQNGAWKQYLKDTSINKGTKETIQDVKLPVGENVKKNNINLETFKDKNNIKNDIITENEQQMPISEKQQEEKVAQILEKTPDKVKESERKWAIFKANILDKGIVFEELSRKTKNRDLQGKWDYTLSATARGQDAIGNARYAFDSRTKTKRQISKSLEEIKSNVGDKVQDFSNYMYHQLNIDRMTLEERFGGDTGINYERKNVIKNKPVFGESITADVSQKIVAQLEQRYPAFKSYAQEVYDFLNANMQELVNSGVVSKESADYMSNMYPHYVPIGRADVKGNAISVPLDTGRTGINVPIKLAKGGNGDILPLFDTIAQRTLQTYRASARNNFGVELKNTLNTISNIEKVDVDTVVDTMGQTVEQQELLQKGKNGMSPTFTVFENGEKITYEITKDMYDALRPVSDSSLLGKTIKPLNKISNFRRGVLTEYNPLFMITNAIKDAQDVLINSQHSAKTYSKFPEAYAQIVKKGYWYQEYVQNGGEQNSYFNANDNIFESDVKKSKLKGTITLPLRAISNINNVIELAPRLSEYIASREMGRGIETSMLDASRVTTNFKAGGDITKFVNRNGATFLNASVQGAMQAVRNVQEANAKGIKGWTVLACKTAIAGLPAIILNNFIWRDDEDYDELQDYVKDNYYCIAKYGDGKFVRIPKGRALATIQKVVSSSDKYITKGKEINADNLTKDFWEWLMFAKDNLAPNDPIDNNVVSPITQVASNTSWYGEDIVPSRLQDKPQAEQYDETTDSFSIWLGQVLNYSPYKINYLLDQYGGGISDVILPLMTKQAENNPIEDKFTTDSTMKSKYPGEFFEMADELKVNANSAKADDKDKIKYKYISGVKSELDDLYNQKRDIQNSNMKDKEKKVALKEVQKEINEIAERGLSSLERLNMTNNTAVIDNEQYYKAFSLETNQREWEKLKDQEKEKNKDISLIVYADYKDKLNNLTRKKRNNGEIGEKGQLKNKDKIEALFNSKGTEEEKEEIYKKYIGTEDKKIQLVDKLNFPLKEYLKYKQQDFENDKDKNGKSISGTGNQKVYDYLNNISSVDLSDDYKKIICKIEGINEYDKDVVNFINNYKSITPSERKELFKILGYEIDEDGHIQTSTILPIRKYVK